MTARQILISRQLRHEGQSGRRNGAISAIARIVIRLLALSMVLILGTLGGCMTQVDGQSQVNVEEAVKNRVAAGLEYLRTNQPIEARQHLVRALELDDRSASTHNAMALLYRYEQDQAREEYHYQQALRADRNYSPARNNYGTLLYEQGRYADAIEQFRAAGEDPRSSSRAAAYANMGRTYVALGQKEEARQVFTRSLRIDPDAVLPFYELAKLHLDMDEPRAAQRYYQQYLDRIGQQTPRSIWLGIRIADGLGDLDQIASLELVLRQRFPSSAEFRAWQSWRNSERGPHE